MTRNARRSSERPVSKWFDFAVFVLIIASLAFFLFALPGCGERDGRPAPIRCDFADADVWDC